MDIVGKRKIWYVISVLAIVPGIVSLALYGLQLGIDFKGGSLMEVRGESAITEIRETVNSLGLKDVSVTTSGQDQFILRYRGEGEPGEQEAQHREIKAELAQIGLEEVRFDTVGPSVSADITRNAFISVLLASLAIVLYIAWAFRNVPPPITPWMFGGATVMALVHDALFTIGLFSILGKLYGVEVDAMFVTAVLTVIGFSVHDTIVVFDRIRENLRRQKGSFESIINISIIETLVRSLNTSITVVFTLLALYLFGGQSIRMFVLALLVGIISGTYSSIFNASPLLVTWHNYKLKRPKTK